MIEIVEEMEEWGLLTEEQAEAILEIMEEIE